MPDPRWHRAVESADVEGGAIVRAVVGDTEVLVARLSDGDPVAFATRCPHQDTPLSEGTIWDDQVRCRQHQYLYDPRTGENVFPARTARPQNLWKLAPRYLPTYPVEEREGWVWVSERPNPPPDAYDPASEERPAWTGPVASQDEEPPEQAPKPPPSIKTVRVAVGRGFELRLPTNPLPGFEWQTEVQFGRVEVVEAGLADDPKALLEAPRWRVKLVARAEGTDEVRCSFRSPWDREPSEVRQYRVLIVPA
ncbi:MAG: Rieske 2Fe-2S domain-containing protein [Actinomycetota bacterium]|nr:Rieske 2Fe-2S domain-containing protein [Actinomycetota bacterium]